MHDLKLNKWGWFLVKRQWHVILSLMLILAFVVSGCSGAQTGSQPAGEAAGQPAEAGKPEAAKSDYPNKPIQFIVPSSAGGGSDLTARALAAAVKPFLDEPLVVVNKGEAGGTIATADVARAKPDGYTILLGAIGPFTTQPHLNKVNYTTDDFRGIMGLTFEPLFIAVHADSPWKTLDDLLKEKDSGKTIKYGSSGAGSVPDLAQAAFFKKAGIKASSVPFKGANPAVTALIGGNVDTVTAHPGELLPHVEAGKLRLLGVYSPERFKLLPDVPTLKEKGQDIDISGWKFIVVPKDTPDEVADILTKAFTEAVNSQEYQEFLKNNTSTPLPISGNDVISRLKKEYELFGGIIKDTGMQK